MKLRFSTLQAAHRLWRDVDLIQELAQSRRSRKWVPPPFWENNKEPESRGETEVFGQVYAQAPGRIRVERGEHVWLARGQGWWRWGGSMPPLRGKGYVDGHLELDRLAPLLDPEYRSIGWAAPAPESRTEAMSDGRVNLRVASLFEGREYEVSELLEPIVDAPIDAAVFEPPQLPFRDHDEVRSTRPLTLEDAARRLPFDLFVPDSKVVPDPMASSGVLVVLVPEAWAYVGYGHRRRRPQIRLELSEKAAIGSTPDRWEERISSLRQPWYRVRLQRGTTEIELCSLYDRTTTEKVVEALRRVSTD